MEDDNITFDLDKPLKTTEYEGGYLEGKLLIATPHLDAGIFSRSVIFLFAHNQFGATGVIINKPIENLQPAALLEQIGIKATYGINCIDVVYGGPVEEYRGFLLHRSEEFSPESKDFGNGISLTASAKMLKKFAAGLGNEECMLAVGYAGWGPKQLEAEIEANSWIIADAHPDLLFRTAHDARWSLAAKSLGIDLVGRFSPTVGHA